MDKRDEVIAEARQFIAQHEHNEFYTAVAYSGYRHAIDKLNEMVVDFAIQHAADVRRQIADELVTIANEARNDAEEWDRHIRDYIKELRGNK